MGYLTAKEAAEMLRVPLNYLEKMGIMPQYHSMVIDDYIRKHNLPIGEPEIVVHTNEKIPGVVCCQSLEECLIKTTDKTRVLILRETNEEVWNLLSETVKIFVVSDKESSKCHMSLKSLETALKFAKKM